MTAAEVRDRLKILRVSPSKDFGQNFLIDPAAIDAIIRFGRPSDDYALVEIGPGLGALTQELAAFKNLTVVEIEPAFCAELRHQYPNIKIVESDIRTVDLGTLGDQLVVFGNLPYSFSTDILFHLIDHGSHIKRAILMLQREFVQRLAAAPGSRAYSVLSVMCQLRANVLPGDEIGGDCFYPSVEVTSQLVLLTFLEKPRVEVSDLESFRRFVAAAFFRRRKKIVNSFSASGLFSTDQALSLLQAAGIDPDRRPETLSVEEYGELFRLVADN